MAVVSFRAAKPWCTRKIWQVLSNFVLYHFHRLLLSNIDLEAHLAAHAHTHPPLSLTETLSCEKQHCPVHAFVIPPKNDATFQLGETLARALMKVLHSFNAPHASVAVPLTWSNTNRRPTV